MRKKYFGKVVSSILLATPIALFSNSCSCTSNELKLEIATTTADLFGYDTYTDNEKVIQGLYDAGFRNVDISFYKMTKDHEYMKDGWQDKIISLKNKANSLGMKFVQAHSPNGNPLSESLTEVEDLVNLTIRSIEICQMLGIKNIVVHAGVKDGLNQEQWFEQNKAFYNKLLPTAISCDVNILCENSTRVNLGNLYYTNTGSSLRNFIKYVNHQKFHGCWDVGHANCESSQYSNIKDLGDEMYAIHYHDNTGTADQHPLLYCGTLNNTYIKKALKEINFRGYFTLECEGKNRNSYPYNGPIPITTNGQSITHLSRFEQEKLLYKSACALLNEK